MLALQAQRPCRVVYILMSRTGRASPTATLPDHPESGEQAFVTERADDDIISFSITIFSRPASDLAKLAGPFARLAQRRMTARYLRSLADSTEHHG